MAKSEGKETNRPGNWFESLNCAFEGIVYAFKTQRHIRFHYVIAAGALLVSLLLKLPLVEFVLFALAVILLLAMEMLNTALEEVVDLVEERHHTRAKNAKDVSAGAVLISAFGVAIMAYIIFTKYLDDPTALALRRAEEFSVHIAVISLLLVLMAVVGAKAFLGRGRPMHGGMPSGHSAVAFSLWCSVVLMTLSPLVAVLTFMMAAMVSHSRLLGGIHSRLEVVAGALLGVGVTLLAYSLLKIFLS